MKNIAKMVAQLELAAQFLCEGDSIKDRLSLILVDNAVELIMHDSCRLDSWNSSYLASRDPARTRRLRAAQGEKFAPKVAYVHSIDKITDDERLFVMFAHRIRNEAYHIGALHEEVMHPIAWTYHALACDFYPRLRMRVMTRRFGDEIPPVIRRHLEDAAAVDLLSESAARVICSSLSDTRGELGSSLSAVLSGAMLARLTEMREALDYLYKGTDIHSSLDHMLAFIQQFSSPPPESIINMDKLARWEERARGIESRHEYQLPGRTLQRYVDLRTEIGPFEERVRESVSQYDAAVDAQIDEARMERLEGGNSPQPN